jgi:hypothetical protein
MGHCKPPQFPSFHFDADPDPVFHFNADPGPASQNDVEFLKKDLHFRLVEMAKVLMFLQLGDFCKCFAAQGEPAGEQPKYNLKWKSLLTSNSGHKSR